MKKIHIISLILLLTLFNVRTGNSQVLNNHVVEEVLAHSDSLASSDSTKPITKTVIMDGAEGEETESSPRDKWITAALAALGVVLVIVFRMLRKNKKSGKS